MRKKRRGELVLLYREARIAGNRHLALKERLVENFPDLLGTGSVLSLLCFLLHIS